MNYKFTNNVPNKDKLFDNVSNTLIENRDNSNEDKVGSNYTSNSSEEVEIELTKNKEGNYLISSGSIVKTFSNEEQEEEQDGKTIIYPATQLYISGMTVVGLFILYRLMMRYK